MNWLRRKPTQGAQVWQLNKQGQREGILCLECRSQGRPWMGVTCEHILKAKGETMIPPGQMIEMEIPDSQASADPS